MVERLSCLQAVRSIQTDPYPHTCVEQALPDALYEELEATFPEQWSWNGFSGLMPGVRPGA